MKKHIITLVTLLCLLLAPVVSLTQPAGARSPRVYVVGDNGYLGFDSDGDVHYTITNDGIRYYNVATYGYCGHHHRSHRCHYVHPKKHKHHKKHYKKHHKKHYKKHYKKHHHDHDDDDDDDD